MLGAMIGDVIGSTYEWHPVKQTEFELFPQGAGSLTIVYSSPPWRMHCCIKLTGNRWRRKPMLCGINSITPAIRMADSVKCSAPGLWILGCRYAAATATAPP